MERGEMPTTTPISFFDSEMLVIALKITILLFLAFYAIFSLIVVRQVDLMSKTLITSVSPIVKAFSVIHAGFAIGLIILVFGLL